MLTTQMEMFNPIQTGIFFVPATEGWSLEVSLSNFKTAHSRKQYGHQNYFPLTTLSAWAIKLTFRVIIVRANRYLSGRVFGEMNKKNKKQLLKKYIIK